MREVAAFEAKNKFGQLLDWVGSGEEVTITRRGKPVARLIPTGHSLSPDEARAALQRIRDRAQELKLGHFDWAELKAYRDEGRP